MPRHSRHVGQGPVFVLNLYRYRADGLTPALAALKFLAPQANQPVPWQRVIGASGTISSRGPGTDGAQRQRQALEAEGVEVITGRTGEMRVDLARFGWFPAPAAPARGAADEEEEDEDDE
ncbi:hypothetical protein NMY22_g11413 [Coprinellus aureogranulatus]|nr:hypothetical protein NMY22_g11413 [Coprinellus aureogranulatus]